MKQPASIHRLVYLSDGKPGLSKADLTAILEKARRNNPSKGLTGLLLYHEGRFFQVLEGDMAQVMACFSKIMMDPRHTSVAILTAGPAEARAFPGWSMGYAEVDELPTMARSAAFSIYDLIPPNSQRRGEDEDVRKQVRSFLASYEQFNSQMKTGS
ncbi:BLUF domain-containing protein [Loktanella sp. IMCC34160]|uniref:BLUF domain-containing protein n=1 Tax=Loktanella sp. IMCC34160 TaxID=2510646 RepID=UPI0013EDE0EF|nr:BLUF domain-containing protein [Loktanella sp. IMCC34160]